MAIGAMQAIKAAGLKIPQDIALIGFNDIPAASLLEPSLSTVSVSGYQMGQKAMSMLTALIRGDKLEHFRVTQSTQLIIRNSCGCNHD